MKALFLAPIVIIIQTFPYLTHGDGYFGGGYFDSYSNHHNYNQNNNNYNYNSNYNHQGYNQNQINLNSGPSDGYRYPVPKVPFSYPEEFERKYRKPTDTTSDDKRDRARVEERLERDRTTTERPRIRDRDDESVDRRQEQRLIERDEQNRPRPEINQREIEKARREEEERAQRDRDLADKIEKDEALLKEKTQELEDREERIRREREELEILRERENALRKQLVDELIAEHRNRTLDELQRFGQNLRQNQQLEDEARERSTSGERRFKYTEEREEIIRRGGQPPVINRSRNTTEGRLPSDNGPGGSRSRFESESFGRTSSNRGTNNNDRPSNSSPGSSGSQNRVENESSSRQSSSSRESSRGTTEQSGNSSSSRNSQSRSSSSSARSSGSSSDASSSESFRIPTRQRFDSFLQESLTNSAKSASSITNDPIVLSIFPSRDTKEGTRITPAFSAFDNPCPLGQVFSRGQRRCINWG